MIQRTKRIVASVILQSSGKEDFIDRLKAEKIDVAFRYTADGRIYGATFIDHNTMCVLNGSRLGKDFSANALEQRFSGIPNVEMPVATVDNNRESLSENLDTNNNSTSNDSNEDNHHQSQNYSQSRQDYAPSEYNDYMPSIPGLDLFQVGPGYDAEEEAFYRAMQRKKKKGRRPKF